MSEIKKTLIEQGKTEEEANTVEKQIRASLHSAFAHGDIEDVYYILDQYGLEPDYIESILY